MSTSIVQGGALGQALVAQNLLTQAQLAAVLVARTSTRQPLHLALLEQGVLQAEQFYPLLAKQQGLLYIALDEQELPAPGRLSEAQARRLQAIVIAEQPELVVGIADPFDLLKQDELRAILGQACQLVCVSPDALQRVLKRVYRCAEAIQAHAQALRTELANHHVAEADFAAQTDLPVARLLQSIFDDAVRMNASDVHIEPDESVLRIRQRIDGVLQAHAVQSKQIAQALTQRLKMMAELDIAERRLPQDGVFEVRVGDEMLDVRLSTMPVQFGESVVMRLLRRAAGVVGLDNMGLPAPVLERLHALVGRPHGIILITGPTGSGKTTTLYSMLDEVNDVSKKLITVEDPVEFRLPQVNQVQVNSKVGLTFARTLRAVLRQDPDVIMIGEIRDQETAEIALRAALTGHLVFATLHTNDAASTVPRLIDMGAEPFLVASALRGVLAQRLLRLVCAKCATMRPLAVHEQQWLHSMQIDTKTLTHIPEPVGCTQCYQTGYMGRQAVLELLEPTAEMMAALQQGETEVYFEQAKQSMVGQLLVDRALVVLQSGRTTLAEVMRLAAVE